MAPAALMHREKRWTGVGRHYLAAEQRVGHAGDGVHKQILFQPDALVRRLLYQGTQRGSAEECREEHEQGRRKRLLGEALGDVFACTCQTPNLESNAGNARAPLHSCTARFTVIRQPSPVVVDHPAKQPSSAAAFLV